MSLIMENSRKNIENSEKKMKQKNSLRSGINICIGLSVALLTAFVWLNGSAEQELRNLLTIKQ